MFVSDALSVNDLGHLTIGGADTINLAAQYGTPLYVMDEEEIRRNCRKFKESMEKNYSGGRVFYASKAFCCKEMYRIINDEGLGIDVVSGGELYTAMSVRFPPERIIFHGNNKTTEELRMAVEYGVYAIAVDNIFEMSLLDKLCETAGKTANIMLRLKPGIEAHTHQFVRTGQIDSKFGFAIETGEAKAAVKKALTMKNLSLTGIHCHIGSQIFDTEPFALAAEVMLRFIADIKNSTGHRLEILNLGGGFPIPYLENMPAAAHESFPAKTAETVRRVAGELNIPVPIVVIEPGRAIVGSSGITLYTVGAVKEIVGIRTYISVDGGMTDNPRYALYGAEYSALLCKDASSPRSACYTIAGKCCESGDLIGENINMQPVTDGDVIAVLSTGAYNYSMSSNYNRLKKPPVVMIKNGESRVVVRGENYDDIVKCDL